LDKKYGQKPGEEAGHLPQIHRQLEMEHGGYGTWSQSTFTIANRLLTGIMANNIWLV